MSGPERDAGGRANGGPAGEVAAVRRRIEELDRTILEAMAERAEAARRIGELKRGAGAATLDPSREAAVIRGAVEAAREMGLPEEPVREIFWTLVGLCRSAQLEER